MNKKWLKYTYLYLFSVFDFVLSPDSELRVDPIFLFSGMT